jgi:hypothetical protein
MRSRPQDWQRTRAKPWARMPHSRKRRSSRSTNHGAPEPSSLRSRASARKLSRWSCTAYREDNKFTWHHVEDAETMLLVPADLNNKVQHVGGASVARERNK